MMRRPAAWLSVCAGLALAAQALAAGLPRRWVRAGGALSEWISVLGGEQRLVGGLGPRLPGVLQELVRTFHPAAQAQPSR
jgi:ABC-type hemin transport system substrate-binding protein